MDTDIWILFVLLLFLIIGGGYFAASETAFATINALHVRQRAENGDARARHAQYILDHFNKALSTLLIGNNVMHIGTAALSTYLVTKLWGEGYTAYSTIITTIVVFLVAEMIPKQFAKDKPEMMALLFAPSMHALMILLTPVSVFFDTLAKLIMKLLPTKQEPTVTEGELAYLIDTLAESESEPEGKRRSALLRSALDFDRRTVAEVMTPLDQVVGVELTMSHNEVREIIRSNKHSRLPVYLSTPDNIVGILDIRTYIRETLSKGRKVRLHQLLRKALRIPGTKRIDDLLDEMTQSRTHMCAVADDSGRVIGIITVEDILEELVGEIMDEDDVGQIETTETAEGGEHA